MLTPNLPGRPARLLDDETKQRILDAVPKVIVQNQVAAMARISKSNLSRWLSMGEADVENDIDSVYAQFWNEYRAAKAHVLYKSLLMIANRTPNYGALIWIIEKCFREDFGKESEEFRRIAEMFKMIFPLIGKGELLNGSQETKEMDSESN